jgi:hypothetical protein
MSQPPTSTIHVWALLHQVETLQQQQQQQQQQQRWFRRLHQQCCLSKLNH